MSKAKIALLVITATAVVVPVWCYISFVGSTEALCRRFPNIDPDVIYEVHKEIYFETMKGKHANIEDDADGSTGEFDKLFLSKVEKYISK